MAMQVFTSRGTRCCRSDAVSDAGMLQLHDPFQGLLSTRAALTAGSAVVK